MYRRDLEAILGHWLWGTLPKGNGIWKAEPAGDAAHFKVRRIVRDPNLGPKSMYTSSEERLLSQQRAVIKIPANQHAHLSV